MKGASTGYPTLDSTGLHQCQLLSTDPALNDPLYRLPLINPGDSHSPSTKLVPKSKNPTDSVPLEQPVFCRAGYNPAAAVAQKVVRKILNLEFVEMAEVAPDDTTHPPTLGRPTPARPPINDISHWVERFSLMAGILCTRFPEKAG